MDSINAGFKLPIVRFRKKSSKRRGLTVRKLIALLILIVPLGIASIANAEPLEDGLAAIERGDFATALRLLKPLSDKGHAGAQYNLGVMYFKGQGVTQDYKEAARLFKLAAVEGHARAQSNLGLMYDKGQGVTQDFILAHMWLNIGASSLSGEDGEKAATARDSVAKKMKPRQIERAQEMARKCQASNFKNCD